VFRELASLRESEVAKRHMRVDHVGMLTSVSPKYPVAHGVEYMREKSSI
jgi:hypothetical protein